MKTTKKEFENLVYQGIHSLGMDDLSSKLMAILYSESKVHTLEELSKKTGYSFSAVSASMKLLKNMYLITTTKKGGSKKMYFSVQRDMLTMTINAVKAKNELMVTPAIQNLPAMIDRCKKSKAEDSKEMLKILEQYYGQMIALDKILKKLSEFTKKVKKEVNKK